MEGHGVYRVDKVGDSTENGKLFAKMTGSDIDEKLEEYDEIKIENTQWSQHSQVIFTMTFVKKKRNIYDFIFSGNVSAECTEETYALVKSWLPESVRMPKVKF